MKTSCLMRECTNISELYILRIKTKIGALEILVEYQETDCCKIGARGTDKYGRQYQFNNHLYV